MDFNSKLWLKISGSITYYLRYFSLDFRDEDLLADYLRSTLNEDNGTYKYLDKQTLEYLDLDAEIVARAKKAFMERLQKRRLKESGQSVTKVVPVKGSIVSFSKYKNKARY
ncbi:hypothetical protein [Terrisporobacter sp.]